MELPMDTWAEQRVEFELKAVTTKDEWYADYKRTADRLGMRSLLPKTAAFHFMALYKLRHKITRYYRTGRTDYVGFRLKPAGHYNGGLQSGKPSAAQPAVQGQVQAEQPGAVGTEGEGEVLSAQSQDCRGHWVHDEHGHLARWTKWAYPDGTTSLHRITEMIQFEAE